MSIGRFVFADARGNRTREACYERIGCDGDSARVHVLPLTAMSRQGDLRTEPFPLREYRQYLEEYKPASELPPEEQEVVMRELNTNLATGYLGQVQGAFRPCRWISSRSPMVVKPVGFLFFGLRTVSEDTGASFRPRTPHCWLSDEVDSLPWPRGTCRLRIFWAYLLFEYTWALLCLHQGRRLPFTTASSPVQSRYPPAAPCLLPWSPWPSVVLCEGSSTLVDADEESAEVCLA